MESIDCIFSTILPKNQHQNILSIYSDLENKVKKNDNMLVLDKNEVKHYFTFSEDIQYEKCTIIFNEKECGLNVALVYSIKNTSSELYFIFKKYEFIFQGNIYYCFEPGYLKKFLDEEFKKKKFHLKVFYKNHSIIIEKDLL